MSVIVCVAIVVTTITIDYNVYSHLQVSVSTRDQLHNSNYSYTNNGNMNGTQTNERLVATAIDDTTTVGGRENETNTTKFNCRKEIETDSATGATVNGISASILPPQVGVNGSGSGKQHKNRYVIILIITIMLSMNINMMRMHKNKQPNWCTSTTCTITTKWYCIKSTCYSNNQIIYHNRCN